VACDPSDNHTLYKERPSLVIEVLSPSTSAPIDVKKCWRIAP
jgi:Uma2 family endonuclease